MMKKTLVLILAGTLCVMLAASGCTGPAPATTPSPAATAAPGESPAVATTIAPPSPETLPWAGTWNSTWLERDGNSTVSVLHLTQAGTDVTGIYGYTYAGVGNFTGSLNATIQGNTLVGTYAESDDDTGFFVFELSKNKRSFTGRWVHAVNKSELAGSALTWNGVRV